MATLSNLPPPSRPLSNNQDVSMSPIPASQPVTMATATQEKHMVHWFRKGLRMHDNPSLREGLKGCTTFRCVFILDPWFAGSSNVGINKWRFLLQCLEDLDLNLRKLNSRLFVIRGQPADILPKLFKEWKTTCLTFEEDPEPFGKVRDQNIMTLCKELSIEVISRVSHTLYDLDLIIEKNGGKTPLTYHQFQSIVAKLESPSPAEATVTPLVVRGASTPLREDHDEKYGVPTLEELGFDIEGLLPLTWKGGETEAMRRLERHLERKAWVASFGRPKMTPQSLLASPTGLSPFLRFGCLSTRLFYHDLNKLYKRIKKAPPPLSLHGQLLWREFFYCAATRNPNFDRMIGNPICVQIPWDTNVEALAKWANAQTGFPWIDAIMTQLREEGWIHHLARHAVACFLTRGDLWVSWEEGMKIFDELLLDADWSVNAGMWMWLSCSSFFQQFFHCYCPVKFGRKADPNGDFIRRYLPVLKNVPTRYIHEPWVAPHAVQKASKCVVGLDYPLPMVNHPVVSKINIERIKQVYRQLASYRGSQINNKCIKPPKSPEAMIIEGYSPGSILPPPPSTPLTIADVSQHPPCCYGDVAVTRYTLNLPAPLRGHPLTPHPATGPSGRHDSPMGEKSQLRSAGNALNNSPMGGNSPYSSGKPMHVHTPGHSGGNPSAKLSPMNPPSQPVKPLNQQTLMLPPATMDDQISGDYIGMRQAKLSQVSSSYADSRSIPNANITSSKSNLDSDNNTSCSNMNSSMSTSNLNSDLSYMSQSDFNSDNESSSNLISDNLLSDSNFNPDVSHADSGSVLSATNPPERTSYHFVQSAGKNEFAMVESVGKLDVYPMSQSDRDGEDSMLNEESNVINIADSIISESEEREKLEQ